MNILQFDYVNHEGKDFNYKIIPTNMGFERCKCFPGEPEKEAWVVRGIVVERSGEKRTVMRSFAIVKMRNVQELVLST